MSTYNALLGMSEMEWALKRMVEEADRQRVTFSEVVVGPGLFDGHGELVGFCQLCIRGLVGSFYPNGAFHPTQELVDLMKERRPHVWASLPDVPTTDVRIKRITTQMENPDGSR